ncbi:hypothetical protein [Caldimonas brevitalea]|uniref:Uncharacterized protein n=1 Tax=Caldimonas brevitalea TaxID=413882 RepID=A0A0G3BL54_9BURK|nr:hypothetical protein [Caldimonas brevitalea]AKJ30132.1 hypothetical protein AAW51_3441 [Caldimonas brevitalea]
MEPFILGDTSSGPSPGITPVCSADEIDYLLCESEMLTGLPGRKFIIAGADRLSYRIRALPRGYLVQRLDDTDQPVWTVSMRWFEITSHFIGDAMFSGQLFATGVS